MSELRTRYKNRQRKERELINPVTNPRYDDVYHQGITWLDGLAGEPFSEGEYLAEFSDSFRHDLPQCVNPIIDQLHRKYCLSSP